MGRQRGSGGSHGVQEAACPAMREVLLASLEIVWKEQERLC